MAMATSGVGPACPRCGAANVAADRRGFSVGKAAAGGLLLGPLGLLGGLHGRDRVRLTCLGCGHEWALGAPDPARESASPKRPAGHYSLSGLLVLLLAVGFAGFVVWGALAPKRTAAPAAATPASASAAKRPPPARPVTSR